MAQNKVEPVLYELRKGLFPFKEDSSMIKISSVCGWNDFHDEWSTFEKQPDFNATTNALRKIASTKDTAFVSGLRQILEEFEQYFSDNWEFALNPKHGRCSVANDNLRTLQRLEETLLSLNFASYKLSPESLFEQYVSIEQRWYKLLYDKKSGHQEFQDFKPYSRYYRRLLKKGIGGAIFDYNFIEPFIDELRKPLMDYLKKYFLQQRVAVSMEVPGFILYRISNIIREDKNSALFTDIAELLLASENMSKTEVARNAIVLLENSQYEGVFERKIAQYLLAPKGTYKMNALLASSYIYKPDFTGTLITLFDSGLLTDDERNYMKRVLGVICERAYTTDVQRHEIKEILDKE